MTPLTVLCYGDSNTHGSRPRTDLSEGDRFGADVRWPGVAAKLLGAGFRLIEEGLPGRTTVHDDPVEGADRNGKTYLGACLDSHRPIDAIVLMLGTNDLKARFSLPPPEIALGIATLIEVIRARGAGPGGGQPKILIVAPAPIEEVGDLAELFAGGAVKSRALAARYAEVASRFGVEFLDAGTVIAVSPIEGVHFGADQHAKLGAAIAAKLQQIV